MKKTLLLALLLTSVGTYAQKTQLRLNLQKDSTYYITCDIKMGIDQFIKGAHHTAKTTIKTTTAHKIVSINDSLYNIEVTYKNMSITFSTGDHEMEFSSENDTSNIFSKFLRLILNKPFNMVMNKKGNIIEIKGLDKIFTDQLDDLSLPEQQKEQMAAQVKQSFGDDNLKNNLQAAFIIYPEQPVGVKDSWTNQTHYEIAIASTKTRNTYTLNSITTNNYEISAKAIISTDKATNFARSGTVYGRTFGIHGTYQYTIKINKATGWINEVQTVKHLEGTSELKHNLTDANSLVFPITIDGTTEVKGW